MKFGKLIFLVGSLFLWPAIIFGLGLIGIIPDELTMMTRDIRMTQLIIGTSLALSIILLIEGYQIIQDGKPVE